MIGNWWEYCTTKIACDGEESTLFLVNIYDDGFTIKRFPEWMKQDNIIGPQDGFPYETICYKCLVQLCARFPSRENG